MPKLKSKLPPIYHNLLPDFIEGTIPEEKWATCDHCVRCRPVASPYVGTKCCDYYPHLANYLVGGILQDKRPEMAEGRNRISRLIDNKIGVTPYGILPPKGYSAQRKENYKAPVFTSGKPLREIKEEAIALRCPYLHEGSCTIWDYRENLCSTHFCISVGGATGREFWKATNTYLKMTENVLSCFALKQLGAVRNVDTRPITHIDFELETDTGELDRNRYQQLWQEWEGREAEFYLRCYELVDSLGPQTFIELGGYTQVTLSENLQSVLDTFSYRLIPEYLVLHPDILIKKGIPSECTLTLGNESTELNPVFYTFINRFDGKRTTTEIINQALQVMLNLVPVIEELIEKRMLTPVVVTKL
jgi:Fe-S-cluster containining protein